MTTTTTFPQKPLSTYVDDDKGTSPLSSTNMNPLQNFIEAMLLMFVRNSDDSPADDDKSDNTQDQTLAELLGFKNSNEVRQLRHDLKDPATAQQAQDRLDARKIDWGNAGSFVAKNVLPPIGAGAMTGNANFDAAVRKVLKVEGGLNLHEPDGAIANFGFNSKANPGLDVRNLTVDKAVSLYKERYWDQIKGIDHMSQAQALVAFDCAVNCGVGKANEMVQKSGGDVNNMLQWRRNYYETLASRDPARNAQYLHSWEARVDGLEKDISRMNGNVPPKPDFQVAAANKPAQPTLWQEAKASISQHLGLNS